MTPRLADYDPRTVPWQREFIVSALRGEWRLAAIRGGLGSGKSLALCALGVMLCDMRPGACVVLGMDTHRRLERVHLPHLRGLRPAARWVGAESCFHFPNGSTLRLIHFDTPAGAGAGTSAVEGVNAHAVLLDECQALRPEVLDVASSRARVAVADLTGAVRPPLVVTCGIPVEPAWWVERTQDVGGRVWLPSSADNARHLGPGWIDAQRALLSERDFQGLIENRPMPPPGQVLYSWDGRDFPEGCVVRTTRAGAPWAYRPEMRTVACVDFGLNWPACVWFAEDVDLGAWVAFAEHAPDDIASPEFARELARKSAPRHLWKAGSANVDYPLDRLIADPAGAARNPQTKVSDVEVLGAKWPDGLGLPAVVERDPVKRDPGNGIVRACLALERRKLLLSGDLYDAGRRAPQGRRTLAKSLTGYIWKRPGEPKKDNVHDHHADVVRYFVREMLWHDHPLDGRIITPGPAWSPQGRPMAEQR